MKAFRAIRFITTARKYLFAGGWFAALAIMVATVLGWYWSDGNENGLVSAVVALVMLCFLLATISGIATYELVTQRRLLENSEQNSNAKLTNTLKELRKIFDSRTGLSSFFSKRYQGLDPTVNLEEATQRYVVGLLQRVKNIFDTLTGRDCSVCIKLLSDPVSTGSTHPPMIVKTIRDPLSSASRFFADDEEFNALENTAFRYLIGEKSPRYFYYNNDLYRSYLLGEYESSRDSWPEFYNATAVCAIKNPTKDGSNEIIGFLCVDNFSGGFEREVSCETLKMASTSLYYVFSNLSAIQKHSGQKTATELTSK